MTLVKCLLIKCVVAAEQRGNLEMNKVDYVL